MQLHSRRVLHPCCPQAFGGAVAEEVRMFAITNYGVSICCHCTFGNAVNNASGHLR